MCVVGLNYSWEIKNTIQNFKNREEIEKMLKYKNIRGKKYWKFVEV